MYIILTKKLGIRLVVFTDVILPNLPSNLGQSPNTITKYNHSNTIIRIQSFEYNHLYTIIQIESQRENIVLKHHWQNVVILYNKMKYIRKI
jgi:hypothetical protein